MRIRLHCLRPHRKSRLSLFRIAMRSGAYANKGAMEPASPNPSHSHFAIPRRRRRTCRDPGAEPLWRQGRGQGRALARRAARLSRSRIAAAEAAHVTRRPWLLETTAAAAPSDQHRRRSAEG